MENYFIHKEGRQLGPYSIEELKQINITRDTMVWYEGIEEWQEANSIKELTSLFKNQPPPFQGKTIPDDSNFQDDTSDSTDDDLNSTKKTSYKPLIIGLSIFATIFIGMFFYQKSEKDGIQDQLNTQQEKLNTQQELLRQQEIERRAEEERLAEEAREAEYRKTKRQYNNALSKLKLANLKLEEINEFHFLRTVSEKQEQVDNQIKIINSWENEVERLRQELYQY